MIKRINVHIELWASLGLKLRDVLDPLIDVDNPQAIGKQNKNKQNGSLK